jgi:hypothetical protein
MTSISMTSCMTLSFRFSRVCLSSTDILYKRNGYAIRIVP